MISKIQHNNREFSVDFSKPLDISLRLRGDDKNPVAWYLNAPRIEPVKDGDFIGKVSSGASTNFNNILFNPHAHGTHTECVGHITPEFHSIQDTLKTYFFISKLISVTPEKRGEDEVISLKSIQSKLADNEAEAIIIRTLPNHHTKRSKKYSHTNWPYLEEAAAEYLRKCGIKHLLIDLPSVDKENDEGKLLAHKAFWSYPKNTRLDATITEMIYVPSGIEDDFYLLNLQIAPFENDATPSKPVIYKIKLI